MYFDNALSGLNAAANLLNIAGNNIANTNTAGFKGASSNFSAMLNSSINANTTGIQNFTQGVISASQNSSDLAINGTGFFRIIDNNGSISYTRNGQFSLNNAGDLVNANGEKLTEVGGAAINVASNTTIAGQSTATITANQYLSPSLQAISSTFNANDSSTYSASNSVIAYDTTGNAQNLQIYYVNKGVIAPATTNTYEIYAKPQSSSLSVDVGAIQIDTTTGRVVSTSLAATPPAGVSASGTVTQTTPASFSGIPISTDLTTVTLNLTGLQQTNNTATNSLKADGQETGFMSGFKIENDGSITEIFTNKQTLTASQKVGLVTFAAPTGLQTTGKNSWVATSASGPAIAGTPNSNGIGSIQSSALEGSNVDMTSQLIDLLAAQRAYQANSQVIKAQDAILQNMVNLN